MNYQQVPQGPISTAIFRGVPRLWWALAFAAACAAPSSDGVRPGAGADAILANRPPLAPIPASARSRPPPAPQPKPDRGVVWGDTVAVDDRRVPAEAVDAGFVREPVDIGNAKEDPFDGGKAEPRANDAGADAGVFAPGTPSAWDELSRGYADAGSMSVPELTIDPEANEPAALEACGWNVTETQVLDNQVITQRVSYESGGMQIFAEVCRPAKPGPHPALIWNHGGVTGLVARDRNPCRALARETGYAVLMSEYRGEGGSEGEVEGCLGEVDDVLSLLACTDSLSYADTSKTVMIGGSHGGCVTTRAVQRGAPVRAAVSMFAPTDWAAEHAFLLSKASNGPPGPSNLFANAAKRFETAAGGTPDEIPEAYAERSPINFAGQLDNFAGDFMLLHGTRDLLVPDTQACELAGAAGGFEARHVDANGEVTREPPDGCASISLRWRSDPLPAPEWRGNRHLVIIDGAGHNLEKDQPPERRLVAAAVGFMKAKREAPRVSRILDWFR